ncbi:MAG: J domain-containing protein [Planctomycetota bacterium]|nr:J domain-containing protein [Planctomycetota bacterium]MDA1139828.1 J domain-containing protein [Planctomycetota bacterium]
MNAWERLCQIVRANFPWQRADELIEELEAHFSSDPEIEFEPSVRSSYSRPDTGRNVDPKLAGFYANLEIPYGAGVDKARHAWKNLLKKYHPDLHHHDPEERRIANELTSQLTRAYREIEKAHNN